MKQEHTLTMLMKQCLSTIEYLQNKQNPFHLSLSYQIFAIIRISKNWSTIAGYGGYRSGNIYSFQVPKINEKLYEAYYQLDHLWAGGKAIKELHKITPKPINDIKSWLAKKHFGKFIYHL